jgi:hypothetical protein
MIAFGLKRVMDGDLNLDIGVSPLEPHHIVVVVDIAITHIVVALAHTAVADIVVAVHTAFDDIVVAVHTAVSHIVAAHTAPVHTVAVAGIARIVPARNVPTLIVPAVDTALAHTVLYCIALADSPHPHASLSGIGHFQFAIAAYIVPADIDPTRFPVCNHHVLNCFTISSVDSSLLHPSSIHLHSLQCSHLPPPISSPLLSVIKYDPEAIDPLAFDLQGCIRRSVCCSDHVCEVCAKGTAVERDPHTAVGTVLHTVVGRVPEIHSGF